jgi:spermidine synthase
LTLTAQVLILREILVVALGQELKLGLALWGWLWWTGMGSLAGGWLWGRGAAGCRGLAGLLLCLAMLLPATMMVIRALPLLGLLAVGESPGPARVALLFLTILVPFGLLSGAFFPLACQLFRASLAAGAGGQVYALEALGATAGVVVVHLLLGGRVSSLALGSGAALAAAASVWVLTAPNPPGGRLPTGLMAATLAALLGFSGPLDLLTRNWQYPGRLLVAAADSPYALLTVSREAEQVSFAANGVWHFTWPDPFSAEQAVQVALLAHPHPQRVLLLGGGAAGLIVEILKTTTVSRLDYVELDPELVRLAQRVLPPEAVRPLTAPQVHVIHEDARRFLERTATQYDVMLMALPEPKTVQMNRFYSQEFFATAAGRLAPGGVLSFGLPAPPAGLSSLRAGYVASLAATLAQVFPQVLVLPGESVRFLASPTPGALTADPHLLAARLGVRNLGLTYLTPYTLETELSRERQEFLARVLAQVPAESNRDLHPRSFFYETALAGSLEGIGLARLLAGLQGLPVWAPVLAWLTAGLLFLGLVRRRPGAFYPFQVVIVGAASIALEILALLIFQIHLGYLYRQLGLLIAAFMLGLAAGGAWGVRQAGHPGRLAALQGTQALLVGLATVGLASLPSGPAQAALAAVGAVLLLAAGGFTGGGVFAMAAAAWKSRRPGEGEGKLYAADLLGATLGAVGVSLLILPAWGVLPALAAVAALQALAGLVAWIAIRP